MTDFESEYTFESKFNSTYSIEARKLVRMLSENSRASISELAEYCGLSRKTTSKKLREVEAKFDIKYTLELNEQAIGASNPHLIMVKFKEKPDPDELARVLGSSYITQAAALTKGDYDLIIYANAASSGEYVHWDRGTRMALEKYGVSWHSSQVVHRQLGFFPLRNALVDRLNIPEKYKGLVKLLNEDSRTSFQQLAKRLNSHSNTLAYKFSKLVKMNYIKRFTLTMQPVKEITLMSFFSTYRFGEGYEQRAAKSRKVFCSDDKFSLVSRYLMCAPMIGSNDFFVLGAFDDPDTAYKRDVKLHESLFKDIGIKVLHATVERVLLGRLPIRSMDAQKVYDVIKWTPIIDEG